MYYIGDNRNKDYENNEGSFQQQNDAHFVELASALAIVDFVNNDTTITGIVKEFGIENDVDTITLKDLSTQTKSILALPLSQYFYFDLFLKNHLNSSFEADFARRSPIIDLGYTKSKFVQKIISFNSDFIIWLNELKNNQRAFEPFELNPTNQEIFKYINKIEPKKDAFVLFPVKNYDKYIAVLNKVNRNITSTEINKKFISLFYKGTKTLIEEKFNF
jgi:hypothetical protein